MQTTPNARTPLRKAQKIWSEFPFLWGITQIWGSVQTIRVQRLDSDVLRMVIDPEQHTVFLHKTIEYDDGHWDDFLDKMRCNKKIALADLLFFSGEVPIGSNHKNEIREIIVLEKLRGVRNADGSRSSLPLYPDRFLTIYKPQRLRSIATLVWNEAEELRRIRALPA